MWQFEFLMSLVFGPLQAGMMATLSTRTSVLGVTNPANSAKAQGCVSDLVRISGPLLSRFDIVLLLLDSHDPQWDALVSDQVLVNHQVRFVDHNDLL
jgi:DNA helicase MCM9